MWTIEDRALAQWVAAEAAYQATVTDRAARISAARTRRDEAMRPYTPVAWGRIRAGLDRDTPQDRARLHVRHDPRQVAQVAERVDNATRRLAAVASRADAAVTAAQITRAEATRTLVALRPADAHLVLGITKNALTRMARTT